jgi:hypothetical protein
MIEYTDDAAQARDSYLREVRICTGVAPSVDADEVVSDIRAHLDIELAGCDQPVKASDVKAVLERLGSPRQWVDREELPWWRRAALDLCTGPDDWRLAYLSIALFVLGWGMLGPIGIVGSFCVSRAALSTAGKTDLGVRKWLIYPSLVFVYVTLLPLVLFWPVYPAGGVGDALLSGSYDSGRQLVGAVAGTISAVLIALSVWWAILRTVVRRNPGLIRVALRPFADRSRAQWLGRVPLIAGIIGVTLGVAAVVLWHSV